MALKGAISLLVLSIKVSIPSLIAIYLIYRIYLKKERKELEDLKVKNYLFQIIIN